MTAESSQIFWTILSILAGVNNAIVMVVSTSPLISTSSISLTNPLGIVLSTSIAIVIIVIFMLHIFLVLWQGLYTYLSFRFLSILLWAAGTAGFFLIFVDYQ